MNVIRELFVLFSAIPLMILPAYAFMNFVMENFGPLIFGPPERILPSFWAAIPLLAAVIVLFLIGLYLSSFLWLLFLSIFYKKSNMKKWVYGGPRIPGLSRLHYWFFEKLYK